MQFFGCGWEEGGTDFGGQQPVDGKVVPVHANEKKVRMFEYLREPAGVISHAQTATESVVPKKRSFTFVNIVAHTQLLELLSSIFCSKHRHSRVLFLSPPTSQRLDSTTTMTTTTCVRTIHIYSHQYRIADPIYYHHHNHWWSWNRMIILRLALTFLPRSSVDHFHHCPVDIAAAAVDP